MDDIEELERLLLELKKYKRKSYFLIVGEEVEGTIDIITYKDEKTVCISWHGKERAYNLTESSYKRLVKVLEGT